MSMNFDRNGLTENLNLIVLSYILSCKLQNVEKNGLPVLW